MTGLRNMMMPVGEGYKQVREKDIEKKLVQGVKRLGGMAYKWVSPGNNGVPDRIVVLPGGRVIFVELKTEKGRVSPIQERQIKRLRKLGCDVRVIKGMAEVEQFLEEEAGTETVAELVKRGYEMMEGKG